MPNSSKTILSSVARTVTTNSATQSHESDATLVARGLHLIIGVTAIVAAPSIVVHIQGLEINAVVFYDLLISNAITTVGTTVIKLYPGIQALPNVSANDILPDRWRVQVVHGNANSITYSIVAKLST